jgi:hypothetical protein
MSTMRSGVENWMGGGSRQMFIVQFRPIIQFQKLTRLAIFVAIIEQTESNCSAISFETACRGRYLPAG